MPQETRSSGAEIAALSEPERRYVNAADDIASVAGFLDVFPEVTDFLTDPNIDGDEQRHVERQLGDNVTKRNIKLSPERINKIARDFTHGYLFRPAPNRTIEEKKRHEALLNLPIVRQMEEKRERLESLRAGS